MNKLFLIVHSIFVMTFLMACSEGKQVHTDQESVSSAHLLAVPDHHQHNDFFFRESTSNEIVDDSLINNNNQFIENYSYMTSTTIRWQSNVIKWWYNPAGQPANYSESVVVEGMKASAKRWSDVCGVQFEYQGLTNSAVNLTKCDGNTVVGWGPLSGSVIGRTQVCFRGSYFNEFDLALDNESPLQINSVDMMTKTAVHELGHAFGLGHTNISPAVMTAALTTGLPVNDDIQGCQSLYGAAVAVPSTPTPTPTVTPPPEAPTVTKICSPGRTKSCLISNGRGSQTCSADGASWSSCQATRCNRGYVLKAGVCVKR